MKIDPENLIDNSLVDHTKLTIGNGEILSFYVDKTTGIELLDRYEFDGENNYRYVDTIKTINLGHSKKYHEFIANLFTKLDPIIDLDFLEMNHNNGSMIDIYHISHSSHFRENVIGQALTQRTNSGGWWDIFWKDSPLIDTFNIDSDKNTIIHEIGHSLGLSHPFNDPSNTNITSKETIMSYNPSEDGWDTWFSENDLNALIKIWGRENDSGAIKYDKEFKHYKFKKSENDYLIKTEIGYEDISSINELQFLDKIINLNRDIIPIFDLLDKTNDISSKIYRLYNAAFGRFPDQSGFKYWIDQNLELKDTYNSTAQSFIASKEFEALYGQEINDKQFITSLYTNILNRSPDDNGFDYWMNQIDQGKEDRVNILMGFSESQENKLIFSNETSIYI